MALSPEDVRWVAHLARLKLSAAELARMTAQLGAIVEYVDQLARIDTKDIEPLAHALEVHNVFREDELAASLPVDEALANAPDRRRDARGDQFYGVPAVLD
jgi:aspartyl-tRNA(Asn)/glutamyl-tRNA(Gln) amidotransferase subunit C